MALIIANTVILAMTDYSLDAIDENLDPSTERSAFNQVVDETELFFTIAFTIEAVLKIIAMGFALSPGAYLREGWNVLDFLVVVSGLLNSIPGMPDVKVLRTLRVLRPLRSLSAFSGT